MVTAEVSEAAEGVDRCKALDGTPAPVRCPSSLEGREAAGLLAERAALAGEAVLLDGLDRWYRLGPEGAGFRKSCGFADREHARSLRRPLRAVRRAGGLRASALPCGSARSRGRRRRCGSRNRSGGESAILRARDEARRKRSVEIGCWARRSLTALALELCAHLDGLVFELPVGDPYLALLPLLVARAALGLRPAIALLPATITPAQVNLYGAGAASDADVLLAADATARARRLAQHRQFLSLVRGGIGRRLPCSTPGAALRAAALDRRPISGPLPAP